MIADPVNRKDSAGKPVGHSTQNVLVYCKKSKDQFLVSFPQSRAIDLKAVAKHIGAKELRLFHRL